ncbi:MAG: S8 family serine peptidase [bacterium]|nr:S8 family serine peptidase [bacterium]
MMKKTTVCLAILVFFTGLLLAEVPTEKKRMETLYSLKMDNTLNGHKSRVTADRAAGVVPMNVRKVQRRASAFDRIIVKYKQGRTTAEARNSLQARFGLQRTKHIAFADLHVYKVPDARSKTDLLKQLNKESMVEYAEPDYVVSLDAVPNDSSFSLLYGMHNSGQTLGTADADIDAPEAWEMSTGSNAVVVAVIDTGIDYTHPDLAANMWQNSGETPGDGIDNDGNGFVDDVYGINSITNSGDPMDDHYHGTHCAGTIGGVGNNGTGVAGVCWNVKLMGLKFLSASGSGYSSDAITCIQYAIAKGAHVMSNSWGGGGYSQSLHDAIAAAETAGILFIAAAGNSGSNNDVSPHYPSSYNNANIISVAATDHNDNLASFSCYGVTSVDVAAPGVATFSTKPGNTYGALSGTSMATPHVAGLAALAKAHRPELTWSQIKGSIMASVDVKGSLTGKILTEGRINAYSTLLNDPPIAVTFTNPVTGTFVEGTVPVTASLSNDANAVKVEFYVDNVLKATDTAVPWQYDWDSTTSSNGSSVVKAVSTDVYDRTSEAEVSVTVNNSGLPGVTILSPQWGETVSGTIVMEAQASYTPGLARVEFYVNDVKVGEDLSRPYELSWNSATVINGSHPLRVVAVGVDATEGSKTVDFNVANTQLPLTERDALIAFYNSTNGDSWDDNSNWKKEDGSFNDAGTEHTWHGVYVSEDHVEELYLPFNGLSGTLPAELQALTEMIWFAVYWNDIGGTIPAELGSLSKLEYLDLDDNLFTGAIPPELGNLAACEEIWLCWNSFSGGIPSSFGNLTNLQYLYMESTGLTGTLPPELGDLDNLIDLTLYWNTITGPIPPEIGNMDAIKYLDLDGNYLNGDVPAELGNLTTLEVLWLNNQPVSGTIPTSFGNLVNLKYLFLYNTDVSGTIPVALLELDQMVILALCYNHLSGAIPTELGNMTTLLGVDLTGNKLVGRIPASLVNLTDLLYLELGYNCLYTNDTALLDFLAANAPGWSDTQTVAPTDVSAEAVSPTAIRVDWTPIAFADCNGGYRVFHGPSAAGPFTCAGITFTKADSSFTINGLTAGSPYYIKLKTRSYLNDYNPNLIESHVSEAVIIGIPAAPQVTLTSPVGGEVLPVDSNFDITWNCDAEGGDIALEYSTSGPGGTFIPIASALENTGSYSWSVPAVASGSCVMRVTASNVIGSDSDTGSSFTIEPGVEIIVISPNGGETWERGKNVTINWAVSGITGNVTVSIVRGDSVVAVLGTPTASASSFSWTIPNNFDRGENFKVRIHQGAVSDDSDGNFSITATQKYYVFQGSDYNGDNRDDIAIFRPSNGRWCIQGQPSVAWGTATDIPVPGDYNGDGNTDIAIFRPSIGRWCIKGQPSQAWGTATDIPVPGDYNGDGTTDIAIFRPSIGRWCIKGQPSVAWGTATDIPVPGDYNGDGTTDIAIFRPSNGRWCIKGQPSAAWGASGDIPVPADYNGDGATDIAIYRPSNGRWCIQGQASQAWGAPGDIAVPADYNGDGSTDIAIFRPSQGIWAVKGQSSVRYGISTDIPLVSHKGN